MWSERVFADCWSVDRRLLFLVGGIGNWDLCVRPATSTEDEPKGILLLR